VIRWPQFASQLNECIASPAIAAGQKAGGSWFYYTLDGETLKNYLCVKDDCSECDLGKNVKIDQCVTIQVRFFGCALFFLNALGQRTVARISCTHVNR
jgi:hypothetical protein